MDVTPQMVKALRDKTGLPMMECKQALTESGGDEAKAIAWLRKKGLGQVSKRAARETCEGRIACFVEPSGQRGALVELLCETAPVASTTDFMELAGELARQAARLDKPTPEGLLTQSLGKDPARKVEDLLHDVVNRIRENIRIAHVGSLTGHLGHYVHHNSQVGVLVEMSEACPDTVKADVCMHIAAMRPAHTRRDEVNPELVANERKLAAEQVKGKPANIIDKIVDGKLNRWYSEIVLLEQPFVKDDKRSVGDYLRGVAPSLTVKRFVRFEVGQE